MINIIYKNLKRSSNIIFVILLLMISLSGYSQGAAINTTGSAADPSAILDVQSDTTSYPQGMLIPRMSTAKRNSINNPAEGLQIYNTTTRCLEIYISPMWQSVFCGCNAPAAVTSATNVSSTDQIVWKWYSVNGAAGYKYNTINNYSSATDNGSDTAYTQTGLACNTAYTLYVWAYNNCGSSVSATLTQSTSSCFVCGTSNITFTYKGSSVSYGSVLRNSVCWMDRNLGAAQVATSVTDVNAYGDLFQWGRLDDGHQSRSSTSTTTLSNSDNPGHSNFIASSSSPNDWRSPQNNNLWQDAGSINNPCPSGWRLPTETELNNERLSWSSNNSAGAFASTLKWTNAGMKTTAGAFNSVNSAGIYWTYTVNVTYSRNIVFHSSGAYMDDGNRASAMSVRCLKDY